MKRRSRICYRWDQPARRSWISRGDESFWEPTSFGNHSWPGSTAELALLWQPKAINGYKWLAWQVFFLTKLDKQEVEEIRLPVAPNCCCWRGKKCFDTFSTETWPLDRGFFRWWLFPNSSRILLDASVLARRTFYWDHCSCPGQDLGPKTWGSWSARLFCILHWRSLSRAYDARWRTPGDGTSVEVRSSSVLTLTKVHWKGQQQFWKNAEKAWVVTTSSRRLEIFPLLMILQQ